VLEIGGSGGIRCGIVPCLIDGAGIARPLQRDTEDWLRMLQFSRDCQARAQLAATVDDKGAEFGGYPMLEFCQGAVTESAQ